MTIKRAWIAWAVVTALLLMAAPALAAVGASTGGDSWLGWARFTWEVAITVAAIVGAVLGWLNRRHATTRERIEGLEKDIEERLLEGDKTFAGYLERMKATEQRLEQAERQLEALHGHLERLSKIAHRLEGAMEATTRLAERLNEYLLQKGQR